MKFKENPYYNPDKLGLKIFFSIDTGNSHEFKKIVIWKSNNNSLYWDQDIKMDSNIPFESNRHDLKLLTLNNRESFLKVVKNHPNIKLSDLDKVKILLREHFKK